MSREKAIIAAEGEFRRWADSEGWHKDPNSPSRPATDAELDKVIRAFVAGYLALHERLSLFADALNAAADIVDPDGAP